MPAIRIGVELASLRLPVRQALRYASQWGAESVVLDARGDLAPGQLSETGIRQLRKMLEDLRLRLGAITYHTRRGYDSPEDLDARVATTKSAMRMAYELGAPLVVNHIGRVPAGTESDAWRMLVEVMLDLGAHGHRVGALFAAETGTLPGSELARLLAALPEGTIAVDFNPGNLVLAGHSPLETIAAVGPAIRHVHASDAAGDPAGHQAEPVAPGRGEVDYPSILAALYERAYQGPYTIQHRTAVDPLTEIPRAIRYLREL